jgi:hypothetical protein
LFLLAGNSKKLFFPPLRKSLMFIDFFVFAFLAFLAFLLLLLLLLLSSEL